MTTLRAKAKDDSATGHSHRAPTPPSTQCHKLYLFEWVQKRGSRKQYRALTRIAASIMPHSALHAAGCEEGAMLSVSR